MQQILGLCTWNLFIWWNLKNLVILLLIRLWRILVTLVLPVFKSVFRVQQVELPRHSPPQMSDVGRVGHSSDWSRNLLMWPDFNLELKIGSSYLCQISIGDVSGFLAVYTDFETSRAPFHKPDRSVSLFELNRNGKLFLDQFRSLYLRTFSLTIAAFTSIGVTSPLYSKQTDMNLPSSS